MLSIGRNKTAVHGTTNLAQAVVVVVVGISPAFNGRDKIDVNLIGMLAIFPLVR